VTVKSTFFDTGIGEYIIDTMVREHPVLRELREETHKLPNATMEIGPEQGQFMQLLVHIIGARRYLEIGVFTGYSSLAVALALPPDGHIVACDVDDFNPSMGRRYWERAGVAGKIDLRIAPALETLQALIDSGTEPFDMAFVDADKTNVDRYYEMCLQLVRPGGVILVDNVLWDGAVIDASTKDPATLALRALNAKAADDRRVDVTLLPVCDGILIARKR
jgi:predicted O-methyltransferase YrrM